MLKRFDFWFYMTVAFLIGIQVAVWKLGKPSKFDNEVFYRELKDKYGS